MKKLAVIFLVLFLFSCSKGNDSDSAPGFIITGTVFVDNQPTPNVNVECGYSEETGVGHDWKNSTKKTDSDGKYRYEMNKMEGIYRYHVKAQNPLNNVWSNYIQSTVTWGSVTHDFYFSSTQD